MGYHNTEATNGYLSSVAASESFQTEKKGNDMASISKQPNGRRTIQFVGADKKRRSIRLGKVSQRDAEAIKVKVERLAAASISGHPPDDETSRWVAGLDEKLRE